MINRIKKFNVGEKMEENKEMGFEDLQNIIPTCDGYMITVTLLKDGNLNSYFLRKKFPSIDIRKCMKKLTEISEEHIETELNKNWEENDKNSE